MWPARAPLQGTPFSFDWISLSNAMKNSQRASETQSVRSIKQSISAIKKEISPVPIVRPCSGNPKARPLTKSTWVRRVVRIAQVGSPQDLSFDEIGLALGASGTESYSIKILDVKAWNVTGPATTSNAIRLAINANCLLSGTAAIQGDDYGSGSMLAGVHINIPDVLSSVNLTSSTSTAFSVSNPLGGSASQDYLFDVTIVMQM